MNEITMATATRNALLAAQTASKSIHTSQNRLNSGLMVTSAIDDAVKYFQAKGLSDRASDFMSVKDGMDQGISLINAAIVGLRAIDSILKQMKGLSLAARTADQTTISGISSQWKDLFTQAVQVGLDSSYNGKSLLAADPTTYPNTFDPRDYFSINKNNGFVKTTITTSADGSGISLNTIAIPTQILTFNSPPDTVPNSATATIMTSLPNILQDGLGRNYQDTSGNPVYTSNPPPTLAFNAGNPILDSNGNQEYVSQAQGTILHFQHSNSFQSNTGTLMYSSPTTYPFMGNSMIVMNDPAGSNASFNTASDINSFNSPVSVNGTNATGTLTNISTNNDVTYDSTTGLATGTFVGTFTNTSAQSQNSLTYMPNGQYTFTWSGQWAAGTQAGPTLVSAANLLDAPNPSTTQAEQWCDTAMSYTRAAQTYFGSNITFLQSKIKFASDYTSTLLNGADKLTLADINEESANLVVAQTRWQFSMQATSISSHQSQSIISLIR